MKRIAKTLSSLLIAALVLGSISVSAFAEEEEAPEEWVCEESQGAEYDGIGVDSAEDILADALETSIVITEETANESQLLYFPDVTSDMSSASYWIRKVSNPDKVLSDSDMIASVNEAILNDASTNMHDLKSWPETYNGIALNEALVSSATADAEYYWRVGVRYKDDGTRYSSYEEAKAELYDPIINNCIDPDATTEMHVKYAIVTTRTCMLSYPTDHPLYDDPTDPDFNYLYISMLRVNEPLVIQARSADGKYYQAISSSVSGWVSAEDIAICADKDEWLNAWDLPSEKLLVVYGDKIYTEDSNYAPETAQKLLPMGTCLELADPEDCEGLIINRRAYNCYVVWLPIRNEDGSYAKERTLIGENQKVSVGYLPVTSANIISVAMNQLGDTYGWGGMLSSEDCSGFVRDVYKCFGLDLARNTTWQANQPVYKYNLREMSVEEKEALLRTLPPGTVLIFNGHEMLYLGEENGKFYVISSVSDVVIDGRARRIRGGVINTMDMLRGNGNTWMQEIHTAEVPYYTQDYVPTFPDVPEDYTGMAQDTTGTWCYLNHGVIDTTFTGICYHIQSNTWFYVQNGIVDENYEGVEQNEYGWWAIRRGRVDFSYNGFLRNQYGWWYLENGKVTFAKNDVIYGVANTDPEAEGEAAWWLVRGSKVTNETTVAKNVNGWWYVKDGKVDFTYTGVAKNENGWWRIENGKVNFNFYGFASNEYGWWWLEGGKVLFNKNDVLKGVANTDPELAGELAWWLVRGGKVTDDTTVAKNANGWWYICDGKVDFTYIGLASNEYGTWFIVAGKVDFDFTGEYEGHTIINGKVVDM